MACSTGLFSRQRGRAGNKARTAGVFLGIFYPQELVRFSRSASAMLATEGNGAARGSETGSEIAPAACAKASHLRVLGAVLGLG